MLSASSTCSTLSKLARTPNYSVRADAHNVLAEVEEGKVADRGQVQVEHVVLRDRERPHGLAVLHEVERAQNQRLDFQERAVRVTERHDPVHVGLDRPPPVVRHLRALELAPLPVVPARHRADLVLPAALFVLLDAAALRREQEEVQEPVDLLLDRLSGQVRARARAAGFRRRGPAPGFGFGRGSGFGHREGGHLRLFVGVERVRVDVLVVALAGDPAHVAAVAVEDDAVLGAHVRGSAAAHCFLVGGSKFVCVYVCVYMNELVLFFL